MPLAVSLLWLIAVPVLGEPSHPLELVIPVVNTAGASDKLLAEARAAAKGYLIDLSQGAEGVLFQAKPALTLPRGRYRLHMLLGAGPSGNDLVDPVEIQLNVRGSNRHVLPREIPKTGDLTDLVLDFTVTDDTPTTFATKWLVGDTVLDVPPQEKFRARQKLLRRRSAEGEKVRQAGGVPSGDALDQPAAGADPTLELGEKGQTTAAVALTNATPKYRLAIAAVHVETLCPVGIEHVRTDKAVYESDDNVQLTAVLRNFSTVEVQAELVAELVSADKKPGERRTAPLTIPAGGTVTNTFPGSLSTHGLGSITRIPVRVSWKETRPAVAEALLAIMPPKRETRTLQKKIFAHYMGCWPAGASVLFNQRQNEGKELRHDVASSSVGYYGGHVRNFDLVDPSKQLTPEESADLEIRRAMRIGIDGFAIDAWAGGDTARSTLDALFKVAESKDYPFELTVCLDPCCGADLVGTVKELLQKHGKSPKLARREGKPLIFGYMSSCYGMWLTPPTRLTPAGWAQMGQGYVDAAKAIGEPIAYHYCMSSFFLGCDSAQAKEDMKTEAAGILARYVQAVGGFNWLGPQQPAMAKAVRAAGAEWSMPVGMYQKENIPFECYMAKGSDWMHWGQAALDQDATLLQIITWNDYGENTCIAPAYNTRYTLSDLTAYEIALWKTGKAPVTDHDRVYLLYRKYPPGARIFPFHAKFQDAEGGAIEVLTRLVKPATIRLPGREIEFEAPAGLSRKQFPVTAGPMIAELVREGKVELRLESPEPITDRPFREDHGVVCWSSEDERLWKEDFGDAPPFWYSEYGDVDHDGLPNWFEMYWFSAERGFQPKAKENDWLDGKPAVTHSRWLDFTTATLADPKADPNGDGKSNLEHYREQSDPTRLSAPSVLDDK